MLGQWGVINVRKPSQAWPVDNVVGCGIVCMVVLGCKWVQVVVRRCVGVVDHCVERSVWQVCVVLVVLFVVWLQLHSLVLKGSRSKFEVVFVVGNLGWKCR